MVRGTVITGRECVSDIWLTIRLQNAALGIESAQVITDLHHHVAVRQTLHHGAYFANSLQRE